MARLKIKLTKDEHGKLDTALQALYVEKNGAFVLDADGAVSQDDFDAAEAKLAEFRDNNVKLMKEAKRFEGVDPDEYRTLKDTVAKLDKQGIKKPDDIAAAVAEAVAKATEPLNTRLKTIETERDTALKAVADKTLEDALWAAGVSAGIADSAKVDFLGRAKSVFSLDGTKIVAKKDDTPLYSKRRNNTTNPLTPEEWASDPEWLLKEAAHLYKKSSGTGAQNTSRSDAGAKVITSDPMALGMNLDALAKGDVNVLANA
jgi:hypothetical protein